VKKEKEGKAREEKRIGETVRSAVWRRIDK
jgi:hypothetical protein